MERLLKMTYPFRRRPNSVFLPLTAFILGICAWVPTAEALPADAVHGEALARRWCASCHIVANDQMRGADNAPAFASIAKMPGFSSENVTKFLMDPHPKMPDMQLSRDETRDLGAYIATLAQ
jgi:mono/diheme cytochrome c family protein